MAKFRILSLDGGGSWALIQVMALINLYGGDATGHQVLRDFDLVAANSGGRVMSGPAERRATQVPGEELPGGRDECDQVDGRDAAAVEPRGPGRYAAVISDDYTVAGHPNGGYLQCLLASAALAASRLPRE